MQRVFETIGFGKVATSAPDAARIGYLRESDAITMNRDRLLDDANHASARASPTTSSRSRAPRSASAAGLLATLKLGVHLAWRAGRISDHDALIGRKLARILAGGDRPGASRRNSSCSISSAKRSSACAASGRPRNAIAHTLKTGKPLRN